MSTTVVSVTLPDDVAARLRARVALGEYESESEVVSEALEAFEDRDLPPDEQEERWLRHEAISAYDALEADPSRGIALDEVQARLDRLHRRATGAA